jgi:alpha-glucosidase
MLGPEFSAEHFRQKIEGFYAAAPNGCPCWSFSNHDVIRHATRWEEHGTTEALAKQCIALLAGFQGSLCLYQGEELGQTETDILYSELTDPPGFKFWPDYKGRDGCRTPMVWDASDQAGFSTATPWLPIKPPQKARNVAGQGADSVLATYRAVLAFRKSSPALRDGKTRFLNLPEPILGFLRDDLMCLYNLSPNPATLWLDAVPTLHGPRQNADIAEQTLTLGANGFVFLSRATSVKTT